MNVKSPLGFRVNLQPRFLTEIIRGCFMNGKLIEDYFATYTTPK
jgi:hypothetical protein